MTRLKWDEWFMNPDGSEFVVARLRFGRSLVAEDNGHHAAWTRNGRSLIATGRALSFAGAKRAARRAAKRLGWIR